MREMGLHGERQLLALAQTGNATSMYAVVLVASSVAIWPSAGVAQAPVSSKVDEMVERRDKARSRLDSSRRYLDENRARVGTIHEEMKRLETERAKLNTDLIETGEKIKQTETKMTVIEERLGKLEIEERQLRGSLNAQHRSISRLLSAIQRMGRNPPPVMITRRSDALAMVRSAMLLARAFPTLRDEALILSGRLNKLVSLMNGIRRENDQLREQAETLKTARKRLASLMRTKRETLGDRRVELAEVQRTVKVIGGNVKSLEQLINKLEPAIARETRIGREIAAAARRRAIAEAEAEARAKSAAAVRAQAEHRRKLKELQVALNIPKPPVTPQVTPPVKPVVVRPPTKEAITPPAIDLTPKGGAYVGNNARLAPAVPFQRAKGRLPMPAAGAVEQRFGEQTKFGGRSKGIVIKTRYGAQITSPTDGWVVYAGKFRTYGQLLIIKAGNGYHVLLAGLSKIDVQSGQFVLAAEPVGTMKSSPGVRTGQNSPRLYVEFRKDGRPINPRPWWSASARRRVQG